MDMDASGQTLDHFGCRGTGKIMKGVSSMKVGSNPRFRGEFNGAFMNTSDDAGPHQVFYGWHGDEAKEGVILRSELHIFLTVMRERMQEAEYCLHMAPVRCAVFELSF